MEKANFKAWKTAAKWGIATEHWQKGPLQAGHLWKEIFRNINLIYG